MGRCPEATEVQAEAQEDRQAEAGEAMKHKITVALECGWDGGELRLSCPCGWDVLHDGSCEYTLAEIRRLHAAWASSPPREPVIDINVVKEPDGWTAYNRGRDNVWVKVDPMTGPHSFSTDPDPDSLLIVPGYTLYCGKGMR